MSVATYLQKASQPITSTHPLFSVLTTDCREWRMQSLAILLSSFRVETSACVITVRDLPLPRPQEKHSLTQHPSQRRAAVHACLDLIPCSTKEGGDESRSPRAAGIDSNTARFELLCQHSAVGGLAQLAHSIHASGPSVLLVAAPNNKPASHFHGLQ